MIDVDFATKMVALLAVPILAGLAVEIIVARHRAQGGKR